MVGRGTLGRKRKLSLTFIFLFTVVRQQKFLRAKFGGVDDEMHDADQDGEEEEEEERVTWGGVRRRYYNADNTDFEVSIEILMWFLSVTATSILNYILLRCSFCPYGFINTKNNQ